MVNNLLSSFGITQKVRQSLTPERQEIAVFPKEYNIEYEDISFQSEDGLNLKGWWIKANSEITIIMSHSFGANRSGWQGYDADNNFHQINWLPSIKALAELGYNIFTFDHRACGESEGELTYFGKKEALDIIAAVNWVKTKDDSLNKFGIIGFSSGANASLRAIKYLEKDKTNKIAGIAVNIYWYERMIANSTKFFTKIPSFMLPAVKKATTEVVGFNPEKEINPVKTLSEISAAIMLVNAESDEIARVLDIRDIYKKRINNSSLQILKNETRFDAYHFIEKHPEQVSEFFDRTLKNDYVEDSTKNEAIILIEFQKTWTEKTIFHKVIKKEYDQRDVLENTKKLLAKARKQNMKIIQAPLILDKTDKSRYNKTPLPARLLRQFTKDTWKAEFTEGIYESSDIVIEGRYDFDATKGSNLEDILKENNIEKAYVCGFTTDHCVKETMDSLIEKGYDCVMVSDCTAASNNKLQRKIEKEFLTVLSTELI